MVIKEIRYIELDGCVIFLTPIDNHIYRSFHDRFDNPVSDYDLARLHGGLQAFGHKKALKHHKCNLIQRIRKQHQERYAGSGLSPEAVEWLLSGEQCLTTAWFFWKATGVKPDSAASLEDLPDYDATRAWHRCLKAYHAVPEVRAGLSKLASASPVWSRLVPAWDRIASTAAKDLNQASCIVYDLVYER